MKIKMNIIIISLDKNQDKEILKEIEKRGIEKDNIEILRCNKRSIDSRQKNDIKFIYNIEVLLKKEVDISSLSNVLPVKEKEKTVREPLFKNKEVAVIGAGPAAVSYTHLYSLKKDRAAMFDQEQSGKFFVKERDEEMDMDSIPLYVTGRYKLPQVNDWQPYLKLNLGYAVNNIGGKSNSRYKSINDAVNSQNGSYYGMGGGIEYNNGLTLRCV